jgi:SAM-dependent methyltransferase
MALHDLVKLKKSLLEAMDVDPAVKQLVELRNNLDTIKLHANLDIEQVEFITSLVKHYDELISQVQQPMEKFNEHVAMLNKQINDLGRKLFVGNYELEDWIGTIEQVRNTRRVHVTEEVEEQIKQRVLLHTSWRYPALEIGCRDGEWTQFLVAADPLYIMDKDQEFINSTVSRFPHAYQNRLRKYQMIDYNLSVLPQGQFAFIFSWGHFNYVSLDTIHQFLKQAYQVLRPGGIFMFSYNNGDTPYGAGLAEGFSQSYMPKSILIPLCQSLGFEIYKEYDFDAGVSWLEISKPGTLHTIKAHQVLGEIRARDFS